MGARRCDRWGDRMGDRSARRGERRTRRARRMGCWSVTWFRIRTLDIKSREIHLQEAPGMRAGV